MAKGTILDEHNSLMVFLRCLSRRYSSLMRHLVIYFSSLLTFKYLENEPHYFRILCKEKTYLTFDTLDIFIFLSCMFWVSSVNRFFFQLKHCIGSHDVFFLFFLLWIFQLKMNHSFIAKNSIVNLCLWMCKIIFSTL